MYDLIYTVNKSNTDSSEHQTPCLTVGHGSKSATESSSGRNKFYKV